MTRGAALLALAYTAALAIWIMGRLALGDAAQATGLIAAGALLITQSVAAALATPWLACDGKPAQLAGLLPLLVTPWPLLVLVAKISGISAITTVTSQIWVLVLVMLSHFSAHGLMRVLRDDQMRTIALTVLQVVPVVALWAGRDSWVPWFTG